MIWEWMGEKKETSMLEMKAAGLGGMRMVLAGGHWEDFCMIAEAVKMRAGDGQ